MYPAAAGEPVAAVQPVVMVLAVTALNVIEVGELSGAAASVVAEAVGAAVVR